MDQAPARARGEGAPFSRIALLGNALPRNCGLATFTSHSFDALAARYPNLIVDHYAMDDGSGVIYPDEVITIADDDRAAYARAAQAIMASGAEAFWLQHEFGIFGGDAGDHILDLIDQVDLPLAVTVHTVLSNPSPAEAAVFDRLLKRADLLIVMAKSGGELLRRRYGVDPRRILVIPHGVPDRPMIDPDSFKPRFDLEGRTVLTTFGLLAPDKGIEHMIEAMPAIAAAQPDALYLVVGATHPNLLRHDGEAYRRGLEARVAALGLGDHVRFINSFVEQQELLDLLQASDVYVTPYLNMAQVTSGTLSYAAAVGKAVVSTPYVHAAELLADERGVLVEPGSSAALAEGVIGLLADPGRRLQLSQNLYGAAREMLWPRVAERAVEGIAERARARKAEGLSMRPRAFDVPSIPLDAVLRMSDDTGIFQHSIYGIPDRTHGYCIDDNARALILAVERQDEPKARKLAGIYAAFVHGAWNNDAQRFRNFMGFDRRWLEAEGSEDSNGRALWALGFTGHRAADPGLKHWARELYERVIAAFGEMHSPRAMAFAAMGAWERLQHEPTHEPSRAVLERIGTTLEVHHARHSREGWDWYEPVLAYDNARLCEAQLRAGQFFERAGWIATAEATLHWLDQRQRGPRGQFRPVGSESFNRPYAAPAIYDQQPLEAAAMIDAALAMHAAVGDPHWANTARRAFGWFVGDNDAGVPIAVVSDGGCYDGLMRHGVNRNRGAESILALQVAAVRMRALPLISKAAKKAALPAT